MSKRNRIVDSKEMARLEKVNARVNFLKARMEKDLLELEEIARKERWLNYLSGDSQKITEEESYRLCEILKMDDSKSKSVKLFCFCCQVLPHCELWEIAHTEWERLYKKGYK